MSKHYNVGGYDDDMDNYDVLAYARSCGNVIKINDGDKQPKDQMLVRGNLTWKNRISVKNPVRVVRGFDIRTSEAKL